MNLLVIYVNDLFTKNKIDDKKRQDNYIKYNISRFTIEPFTRAMLGAKKQTAPAETERAREKEMSALNLAVGALSEALEKKTAEACDLSKEVRNLSEALAQQKAEVRRLSETLAQQKARSEEVEMDAGTAGNRTFSVWYRNQEAYGEGYTIACLVHAPTEDAAKGIVRANYVCIPEKEDYSWFVVEDVTNFCRDMSSQECEDIGPYTADHRR